MLIWAGVDDLIVRTAIDQENKNEGVVHSYDKTFWKMTECRISSLD